MLYNDDAMLNWLDRLIAKYRLHSPDPQSGVLLSEFIEPFFVGYQALPSGVLALVHRCRDDRRHYINIAMDVALQEPDAVVHRRCSAAHELGHILNKDKGLDFVEWRDGPCPFDSPGTQQMEKAADAVAAYLLIPKRALHELEGMEISYIARRLGVWERLVPLRFETFSIKGR